jgi:hypothetical protein
MGPTVKQRKISGSRNLLRQLRLLFVATLAMPLAFAQNSSTTFDKKFNFSEHKRYTWGQNSLVTRQHPDTNEVMHLKIVKAVNQILTSKGFAEVKEKPDLYIFYDGGGDTELRAGNQAQANSTQANPNDRAPTYGLGNGPALAPSTWLKVNGRIVFHIADESRKVVWETTYTKTFHDPQKALRDMDKVVSDLVSKSFRDFPPNSKK